MNSTAKQSFPLWAFLELVEKAGNEAFINHCEGVRALNQWLQPQIPLPPLPISEYEIPQILDSYLLQEITKVLVGPATKFKSYEAYCKEFKRIKIAIYHMYILKEFPTVSKHIHPIYGIQQTL